MKQIQSNVTNDDDTETEEVVRCIRYRDMGYAEIEERWHTDAHVRTVMPY